MARDLLNLNNFTNYNKSIKIQGDLELPGAGVVVVVVVVVSAYYNKYI